METGNRLGHVNSVTRSNTMKIKGKRSITVSLEKQNNIIPDQAQCNCVPGDGL